MSLSNPSEFKMKGTKTQYASLLDAEESRVDMAVFALYPGGDLPRYEEEAERKQKESALSSTNREVVALSCLSLAHDYMNENRETYQRLARGKSPQHGMREDDVLASVLHQMWAGCYRNALSLPDPISISAMSSQTAKDLFKPKDTPERFSAPTLQALDHAIRRFAEANSPDVSGPPTYNASVAVVVAAACLVIIVELFMFFVRYISKRLQKAPQEVPSAVGVTESTSQNEAPPQSSLHWKGPSKENSKVAGVRGMAPCKQRSSLRRGSTAASSRAASGDAPQRSS